MASRGNIVGHAHEDDSHPGVQTCLNMCLARGEDQETDLSHIFSEFPRQASEDVRFWESCEVAKFRSDVKYYPLAIDGVCENEPDRYQGLLKRLEKDLQGANLVGLAVNIGGCKVRSFWFSKHGVWVPSTQDTHVLPTFLVFGVSVIFPPESVTNTVTELQGHLGGPLH